MKLFGKKKEKKEVYKIAFCDTPDLSTKFGEWDWTYDTYADADRRIRTGWKWAIEDKTENAYKIDDAWLVIEKVI